MENRSDLLTDIFRAYFDARKNKRNTRSQLHFEMDLEHNLVELCDQIVNRNYRPSPGICFITNYPVKREIFASPFRDRVVHHLLFGYLAPIFEPRMIFDSYSCRKEKGTLQGIQRLEHHIRSCTQNYTHSAYVLKLDLKGYFMSINKCRLYEIISRTIERHCRDNPPKPHKYGVGFDRDLTDYLIRAVLFRNPVENCKIIGKPSDWYGLPPSKSLLKAPPGVGLPIGDLTSQLFSNIYLDVLDEFVKRKLGCRHYGRYVDDFYIVHRSREYLCGLIPVLRDFLQEELLLTLHPDKIVLQHYTHGASFLGAYIRPHRRYSTDRTVGLFRNAVAKLEAECRTGRPTFERLTEMLAVINSYCGHLIHFRAYRVLEKQFANSPLKKYFRFTRNYGKAKIKYKYKMRSEALIAAPLTIDTMSAFARNKIDMLAAARRRRHRGAMIYPQPQKMRAEIISRLNSGGDCRD